MKLVEVIAMQLQRQHFAYIVLLNLVICGLATSTVVAGKVLHLGINFPASNLIFSLFSYPIIDCICELWGKRLAKQSLVIALGCQALIAVLINGMLALPAAPFWHQSTAFDAVLGSSQLVVVASLVAFGVSQLVDIVIYQAIKNFSQGRWLWLRSNVSTLLGQVIDSFLFVAIVFHASAHKLDIIAGSIVVKLLLSIAMTPAVYAIVMSIDRLLDRNTLAFAARRHG